MLLDNAGARIDAVMQVDDQIVLDVFGHDLERVAVNFVTDVAENKVAISVVKRHLETGFGVHVASPAGILAGSGAGGAIEGSPFGRRVNRGEIRVTPQLAAPINVLQLVALVHAENVAGMVGVEHPQLLVRQEADGFLGEAASAECERGE